MSTLSLQNTIRVLRKPALFVLILLAIEFLDEFVFGAREAAWPLIRSDLQLTYEQIGLLMSIPTLLADVIEPMLGILGDVWKRRILIVGGGMLFTLALALTAISRQPFALMLVFIILNPASGAFVSLSQASLMDVNPARHEQNMARWTLAGSLGVVGGSLSLGALIAVGGTWRLFFALAAVLSLLILVAACRFSFNAPQSDSSDSDDDEEPGLLAGIRAAFQAFRRHEVLRWLVLLEFANLTQDILYGYLALYFVDVVQVSELQAGFGVAVWTCIGLVGSLLLIPLLERVRGLTYLRISAGIEVILFALFLIIPGFIPKVIVLAALSLITAGGYPVLMGQLYTSMPGQSGTVLAITNVGGLIGGAIPFCLGLAADHLGLQFAIWLLILGPIAIMIGLPRKMQTVK